MQMWLLLLIFFFQCRSDYLYYTCVSLPASLICPVEMTAVYPRLIGQTELNIFDFNRAEDLRPQFRFCFWTCEPTDLQHIFLWDWSEHTRTDALSPARSLSHWESASNEEHPPNDSADTFNDWLVIDFPQSTSQMVTVWGSFLFIFFFSTLQRKGWRRDRRSMNSLNIPNHRL